MLNKHFKVIFFPLVYILLFVSISCSKYEENEGLTLKSKKQRLVGKWTLKEVSNIATNEILDSSGFFKFSFYNPPKDTFIFESYSKKENVEWEFEGDNELKEKFALTSIKLNYGKSYSQHALYYDTIPSPTNLTIKKWSFSNNKKELKVKDQSGVEEIEYNILKLTNTEIKLEDDFGTTLLFSKE